MICCHFTSGATITLDVNVAIAPEATKSIKVSNFTSGAKRNLFDSNFCIVAPDVKLAPVTLLFYTSRCKVAINIKV